MDRNLDACPRRRRKRTICSISVVPTSGWSSQSATFTASSRSRGDNEPSEHIRRSQPRASGESRDISRGWNTRTASGLGEPVQPDIIRRDTPPGRDIGLGLPGSSWRLRDEGFMRVLGRIACLAPAAPHLLALGGSELARGGRYPRRICASGRQYERALRSDGEIRAAPPHRAALPC